MSVIRQLRAWSIRLFGLLVHNRRDRDMAEEFESHFEMQIAENIRSGMTETEARRRAALKSGGVESAKEIYRDRTGIPWIAALGQDTRYGLRQLWRNPGFAATAVLLLALGIGANAAIYSFLDAILVRTLPVWDPGALVLLKWQVKGHAAVAKGTSGEAHEDPQRGYVSGSLPYPFFETLTQNVDSARFSSIFGFANGGVLTFNIDGSAETARTLYVSGDFFTGLGVLPVAGRLIASVDDREDAPIAAVISHAFWQAQFAGDPNVIGNDVLINGQPSTIIGITRPSSTG